MCGGKNKIIDLKKPIKTDFNDKIGNNCINSFGARQKAKLRPTAIFGTTLGEK